MVAKGPGRPSAAYGGTARERILEGARRVFSEVGYDAATYQAIAEHAGVTRPAVNHHFRDKRLLYRTVAGQTSARVVQAGMQRAATESTLLAQIEAFLAGTIEADSNDHLSAAFLATSFLEYQRHPELRNDDDGLAEMRKFLATLLDAAIVRGELPADTPVSPMADALLAILWGIGFYAGFVGTHAQLQAVAEQLCQLLAGAVTGRRA